MHTTVKQLIEQMQSPASVETPPRLELYPVDEPDGTQVLEQIQAHRAQC